MTKKLQRMTPNPTFSNPTSNRSKNRGKKSQKLPPIYGSIVEGRIEGRIQPCQEKKKMNTPPCTALVAGCLPPSSMALS
jgi:hypothetical protein